MRSCLALGLLLLGCACGTGIRQAAPLQRSEALGKLVSWMTGSFSSAKQAEGDEDYMDIRLYMVEIWRERADGPWLYVEQAVAQALDKPYRQRVYRLREIEDGLFESSIYAFPDPKSRTGAWRDPVPLPDLSPSDLEEKTGCGVILRSLPDRSFGGGTLGTQCANSFGGAHYATSQVTVHHDRVVAWDQGYAEDNKALWGPEKGPYLFLKLKDLTPLASPNGK